MSIKLVIFDADNTLIDFYKCERFGLEYLFAKLNIQLTDEIHLTFSQIDDDLWTTGKWMGNEVSKEEIPTFRFKLLFEKYDIDSVDFVLVNKLFMEGFKDAIFPLPESHYVVEFIYNKGLIVCVATNGLVELQYPRIKNTSFGKYITQIVASEEVGDNKPDSKIFEKILKSTNIKPTEAIVVGDSLFNDILGASNAGIRSVWYNPKKLNNKSQILADYEISKMCEIKEILNSTT